MAVKTLFIRQAPAVLEVADGQTLLEAALAQDVPYPHGCRAGRCGACKSRLVAGEVDLLPHSRHALTDDEKAGGLILACRAVPRTDVAVAWVASDLAALPPSCMREGVVLSIDALTHDIRRVRIGLTDGAPLAFAAGQYADIRFGNAPARSYSMANPPGDPVLEFHIRRVPGGVVSGHVHTVLKPGDPVTLEIPRGASHLRDGHCGPMLCLAGGSGLAPIKAIVETALALGMRQPIHVYFGAREEHDLYLTGHFQDLARRHANLCFVPVLSEARATRHRRGLVTRAAAEDLPRLHGWKVYAAGPPAMVDAAMEMAFARGLAAEDLHADVFFTPDALAPAGGEA
ncbi:MULTISPECIES: 2Fe-2S iron-sulfur cluster-binding protein [Pseudomonadota]|jgi:NAD(P)H-flavin reductase/ferredoxin|uniref:2Fe-2S iron-sulfur cluster-binding protein n=1 Tax=Pseudomonadota TaxID=1224 RepID=UPI001B338408|nr:MULTISPECIES: 2Fe-2S iron-sulfur cluster-binding protein [Pseudomonadota]EIU1655445.1 2Fe-2S iron-sulfur cluster binding domain-containing protein [Pseudomonas aeruginosa]MBP3980668.1 2Fe-2S iron-sulfur cluster binding domain-containing protein [Acidovorax sp. JG5]MCX2519808.1 2Fe-2S iron-sulfur cluster-binding protein [Pseudomonas aeruginosa]